MSRGVYIGENSSGGMKNEGDIEVRHLKGKEKLGKKKN
jgi:hypothetical protein